MSSLIVYLGLFYIVVGAIFLFVPLIYLELGRPKDFIKAFLNLLIGFVLIIKYKTIIGSFFVMFLLLTMLIFVYEIELFLFRWNQLTDKEKSKLITFLEFKKNISILITAFNVALNNFTKPFNIFNFQGNKQNISTKKWVRNDKNDNIKA